MKLKRICLIGLACMLLLAGCQKGDDGISEAPSEVESAPVPAGEVPAIGEREQDKLTWEEAQEANMLTSGRDDLDMDLTVMGPDMVFATLYNVVIDPEPYDGQTIRLDGVYAPIYLEDEDRFIHHCIVSDAMACCAQGIEFVWDDGSHHYPEEYPPEGGYIIVEGTIQVYDAGPYLNIRIVDASLEVL